MSLNKYKDISFRLDNNSVFNIINYKENNIHPILQAAITLIFFTKDEEFRSEYGGIYHLIGGANSNIQDDLELDLAHMSFAITEALQQTYPEVSKTDFIVTIQDSTLTIDLNITVSDGVLTSTIYTKEVL